MILNEILEHNAVKYPSLPALTMRIGYRTISLNYKQVYDLSRRIAIFLQQQGIGKGDKVIIFAPNSPYWVCVFWGVLLNGSIAVPVNVQSTAQMIDKIIAQTQAKIIFKGKYLKYNSTVPSVTVSSFVIDFIDDLTEKFDPNNFKKIELNQDDLIEILYTSGTTGDPKGVLLTHNNLLSNVQAISTIIVLNIGTVRILSILPLTHILEQTIGLMLAFFYVAHIIYAHSYAAIGDLLCEYRIDKMVAVPEFLKVFMQRIKFNTQSKYQLIFLETMLLISQKLNNKFLSKILLYPVRAKIGGSLDTIATGGAPLEAELEREWRALGIDLIQGYGLTETSPVVCLNSFKFHRLGSVGRVLPGVSVRLGDDGEILVKGPGVFHGYYKDEAKTRQTFTEDGWFKTGDMGYFDKDEFLFLKGRKKYMILGSGGQNVFPEDIEIELNKITGVKDSCVLGLERHHGHVIIHAVLLLDQSSLEQSSIEQSSIEQSSLEQSANNPVRSSPEQIIEQANLHLASYQLINSWSVWAEEDFPRSATRKVKRDDVKKALLAQMNGETKHVTGNEKSKVMYILSNVSGTDLDKINLNTRIVRDLNMDSLMRVELVMRLELELGVSIDESKISTQTTVQQLEDLVEQCRGVKKTTALKRWPRNIVVNFIRKLCQGVFLLISRIFMPVEIEGRGNLIKNLEELKTPVIFMPNHISYHDALAVMAALPAKFRKKLAIAAARDVLYEEYSKLSWLAELFFNSYPLSRLEDESIKPGLENTGKLIDWGYSILVFPEGKVSLDGQFQPLKLGAGFMAVEMGVAIVPIKIEGADKIAPYGCLFPRNRAHVTVKFGTPIKFEKTDSYEMAKESIEKVMKDL